MPRQYSVSTGLASFAQTSSAHRELVTLTSPATASDVLITGFDVTFDSTNTPNAFPLYVCLYKVHTYTGWAPPSGGSIATPVPWRKGSIPSVCTATINDTYMDGGQQLDALFFMLVWPTAGLIYQFPRGREPILGVSDIFSLRLQQGYTYPGVTCNYEANLDFEE